MTYLSDILKKLDQKFPVPSCDMGVDKDMFGNRDGDWLAYGTICQHDDDFMCDARMEAIRQFIRDLCSPAHVEDL